MSESKTKVLHVFSMLLIINTSLLPVQVSFGSEADRGAGRLFRAGAAASNITPPLDRPIIGGWNSPPGVSATR